MQADNQGYGSLQGDGTTVLAGWYWSPVRSEWMARANFRLDRGPGNFLYINTWDASAGVGRQVQRNTRIMGEYLYNRHGSKGFEGFHLTRQAIRLNLVWTPQKGLF